MTFASAFFTIYVNDIAGVSRPSSTPQGPCCPPPTIYRHPALPSPGIYTQAVARTVHESPRNSHSHAVIAMAYWHDLDFEPLVRRFVDQPPWNS